MITKEEYQKRLEFIYKEIQALAAAEKSNYKELWDCHLRGPGDNTWANPALKVTESERYGLPELRWFASSGCEY